MDEPHFVARRSPYNAIIGTFIDEAAVMHPLGAPDQQAELISLWVQRLERNLSGERMAGRT